MGIIVRCEQTGIITFYSKGADIVIKRKIEPSEWLDEEVENLAREGLRTLVFCKKTISQSVYAQWQQRYNLASISMQNRCARMESIRESLEIDMHLLGVTGVEDKLQQNVQSTLEILRNAHIKGLLFHF